jgi:HAD superfamily hydrolase (TIGR01490 family)
VIAFFDVDNTLLRGASVYYVGRAAFRRGLISWRDVSVFAWHQFRFLAVGENHRHLRSARTRALGLVRGHRLDTIVELTRDVYLEDIVPNLLAEMVERAKSHVTQGHEVWLVTATPTLLADVIVEGIGVTGALGTGVEISDGRFTGEILGDLMHGPEKARVAVAFAADRGADLADCVAYSDSANDIPLLEAVGTAVAVNPDKRLAAHAVRRGWQVIRTAPPLPDRAARAPRRRA